MQEEKISQRIFFFHRTKVFIYLFTARIGHTKLRKQDVEEMLNKTPSKSQAPTDLFRSLHSHGKSYYSFKRSSL